MNANNSVTRKMYKVKCPYNPNKTDYLKRGFKDIPKTSSGSRFSKNIKFKMADFRKQVKQNTNYPDDETIKMLMY